MSRINNSLKNVGVAVTGQVLGLLISVVSRIFFVKYLNEEYLGINGLFTNIMALLSLADLGIGGAMIFSLYKPISENDNKKTSQLMELYRRIYVYICLSVFLLGVLLMPFLEVFIKKTPNIENIHFIFFLYIINSASTYLFTYKRSLIIANQKEYISSILMYSKLILVNILQILILIYTGNFILYLIIQFLFNFIENFIISIIANKMYPFLRKKPDEKLDLNTKNQISKNIKAMLIHKIGTIVVFNTDNLILSYYLGIGIVGIYSNYLIIINAIKAMTNQFFSAITASVGNLSAVEKNEIIKDKFLTFNFLGFWVYGFSSISLLVLLNPFIKIWLGEKYIFENIIVLALSVNFYINGMRQATLTFRSAMGLFWYDRYKPVFESILNLIFSIVLVQYIGILGVLVGTILSTLFTCSWIEPYVLFKYGFKDKINDYAIKYLVYFIVVFLSSIITLFFTSFYNDINILNFIIKIILCLLIPNLLFYLFFFRTKEFKALKLYWKQVKLILLRRGNNKRMS